MKQKKSAVRRRRERKRHSSFAYHRKSMMGILMVVGLLFCVLTVNAITLQAKNEDYKKKEAELEAMIEEELARSEEIEEYQEYVKTDAYIKELAEEKMGLVDPDEIIFKPAR
jgi:cell division protein DivIC